MCFVRPNAAWNCKGQIVVKLVFVKAKQIYWKIPSNSLTSLAKTSSTLYLSLESIDTLKLSGVTSLFLLSFTWMRNNYFRSQTLDGIKYQTSWTWKFFLFVVFHFIPCSFSPHRPPPPPQKSTLSVDNFPLENVYKSNSHLLQRTNRNFTLAKMKIVETKKDTKIILKANFIENLNKNVNRTIEFVVA